MWNKQLFAYVNHARIRSWNQPVLSNESKVSLYNIPEIIHMDTHNTNVYPLHIFQFKPSIAILSGITMLKL